MNRSAKGLLITTTTLNGFSLANCRQFAKFAKLSHYMVYYIYIHLQAVWDEYGIDWEGPVRLADETTVTIDELGEVLNDSKKEQLHDMLSPLTTSVYCKEEMIGQYAVAKAFVAQHGLEP